MLTANLLRNASLLLVCGAFIAISGCEEDPTQPASQARTVMGESKTVGNGTGQSWVKLGNDGKPTSVGLTLSEAALTGLPANPFPPTEFVFTLPAEAGTTVYKHISLDWNSQGHEPTPIYTLPHFDVHFYHITPAERDQINPADTAKANKMPDSAFIPTGYFTPPPIMAVPRMGVHWVDPNSSEFHQGHTFDKTLIYGFWDGKMVFTEPMITVAYLQSNPNFTENLKLPKSFTSTAYVATKYSIKHDAAKKEYHISLDSLVQPQAL